MVVTGSQPASADDYLQRGSSKGELGDYLGAIADYDRALRLRPDLAFVYLVRGAAKLKLEQCQNAFDDFDHLVQTKPDDLREDVAFTLSNCPQTT